MPKRPEEEEQRLPFAVVQVLDLADPEDVVAGGVDIDHPATDVGECPVEQRQFLVPDEFGVDRGDTLPGEMGGEVLLILRPAR